MGSILHVIGLGPAGLDGITLGDYKLLQRADMIIARTINHPAAQELMAEGFSVQSYDHFYENGSFEQVYEQIVDHLEKMLAELPDGEIVYAVPGNPMVAEKSVQLILEKVKNRYPVIVHSANSFLDEIFSALEFDPIDGFLVRNYDALKSAEMTGREWLVVPQVYNKLIASEVKLDLMAVYPDEMEVFLVSALGTPAAQVDKLFLYELDHSVFDHLSTVVVPPYPDAPSWSKLLEVIARLRAPEGCPWDREQTHESLVPFLIEESYEVIEAIDNQDMYNLCEELGDLLLQVVLHAQIASENHEFEMHQVLQDIIGKMIRRHPHVFSSESAETADEVLKNWEQIKQAEKGEGGGRQKLFNHPKGLPALMLAEKTQKKAAKYGFDWPTMEGPLEKVKEELAELEEAIEKDQRIKEELGDLLFSVVNLSRFLKTDSEEALRQTVSRFQNRFEQIHELALKSGHELNELTLAEMDILWEEVKQIEKCGLEFEKNY